jgi:hypothetical protein
MSMRSRLFLLSLPAYLTLGCDSPTGVPDGAPAVEGSIISFPEPNMVFIRPRPSDCVGYVFTVTENTKFFVRSDDGKVRPGSASDMLVGQNARGWVGADPIDDTCQRRTSAGVIEITAPR